MTDAPETRKTHVIRILGTNKNGDVLPEIWADVERIDRAKYVTQTEKTNWQGVVRKFRWLDNPDSIEGVVEPRSRDGVLIGPGSRDVVTVKVCSPDEADLAHPQQWIPIDVIKHVRAIDSDQARIDAHINEELTDARVVSNRRVFHRDTSIDANAEAAFAADPTRKVYVSPGSDYKFINSDNDDKSQYIEHQVIKSLKGHSNENTTSNGTDQGVKITLLNQYIIDQTDPAKLLELGAKDINPPYRLDPFQNIINIQLSSLQRAVAGILDISHSNVTSNPTTLISKDGKAWGTGFGADSGAAASGLGYTVVATNKKLVAFGKPKDGAACFIAVRGADGSGASAIERGTLNERGELDWTTTASLPGINATAGGAYSCTFAGDAFFISYLKGGTDTGDFLTTFLAVSFDGHSFTTDIQPFKGVAGFANPDGQTSSPIPDPNGGCVAYDKKNKRYVTTGSYLRWYKATTTFNSDPPFDLNFGAADRNLMSSVSVDGISWTAHFDTSEGYGNNNPVIDPVTGIEMRSSMTSSVCFGKGLFVAASSYKNPLVKTASDGSSFERIFVEACSVATSSDGKSWTNKRLPSTLSELDSHGLQNGGDTEAVGFIKTSGTDKNGYPNGFFVAVGTEFTNLFPSPGFSHQTKFWFSTDGLSWQLAHTEAEKTAWIISAVNKTPGKIVFH